ncbi:MAG: hypothetical protein LJE84_02470 [Gammaproteobacteria bacterium]|jgi:hypothetical protein|nr:hypothetical protein [Gammaproteobacteria bacterium]
MKPDRRFWLGDGRDDLLFRAGLFGVCLAMALLAFTPGISFTEDLGRHILLGKITLQNFSVPDTNLLSYTHPDFPFVNHHWGSEVVLYLLHEVLGLNGLILWKMAMLVAALALAWFTVRPQRGMAWYWLLGLLAAIVLGYRAHIRPELFTYLAMAAYLFLFEQVRKGSKAARWWLVGIAFAWANLHIYFMFGLGMAGAFLLERLAADRSRDNLIGEGRWFGLMVLVSCVNPNLIGGLLYPFQIFSNYAFPVIENESPWEMGSKVLNPMLLTLPVVSAIVVVALFQLLRHYWHSSIIKVAASLIKRDAKVEALPFRLANTIIAATALIASWWMARSAALLVLAALPLVAEALSVPRRPRERTLASRVGLKPARVQTAQRIAGPLLVGLFNLWLVVATVEGSYSRGFPSPIAPTPFGFDDYRRYQTLKPLLAAGLRGPFYNDYNIGSLVEYEIWPQKGYADNRPEAFPASFWQQEYLPALSMGNTFDRVMQGRAINAIVVSFSGVKEYFIRELQARPEWTLIHVDDLMGVWVRHTEANAHLIAPLVWNEERKIGYDRQIAQRINLLPEVPWYRRNVVMSNITYALYAQHCIGDSDRMWKHLKRLHDMYPDDQDVIELMRVAVPRSQLYLVENLMRKRARWPLSARHTIDWGNYLARNGKLKKAREVMDRGRWFFPGSWTLQRDRKKIIAQLEQKEKRILKAKP